MKVEYSNRAVANLRKISADSRRAFGDRVAQALEGRIRAIIDLISREPLIMVLGCFALVSVGLWVGFRDIVSAAATAPANDSETTGIVPAPGQPRRVAG